MDAFTHTGVALASIMLAFYIGQFVGHAKGRALGMAVVLLFFKSKISREIMDPVERQLMNSLREHGLELE